MTVSLDAYLVIAQRHVHRIRQAQARLAPLFPLTAEKIENLSDDDMVWIELLVNRFAKLQDLMGTRLINAALLAFDDAAPIDQMTMRDKLNQLEKRQVIENADLWSFFRTIRNNATHEYPDDPPQTAKHLNEIYDHAPELIVYFERLNEILSR